MNGEVLKDTWEYLATVFSGLKPYIGGLMGVVCYVCFPDRAYLLALMAVLGAALMDIITKIVSIVYNNGGVINSIKEKKLFSKTFWKGTERKIISYLSISILTGLSYRVIYLKEAGILLGTFVYSVMFMREFQSNIENLIEAGAELDWLLLFSRKKNKDLMKPYEEDDEESSKKEVNEDYDQKI